MQLELNQLLLQPIKTSAARPLLNPRVQTHSFYWLLCDFANFVPKYGGTLSYFIALFFLFFIKRRVGMRSFAHSNIRKRKLFTNNRLMAKTSLCDFVCKQTCSWAALSEGLPTARVLCPRRNTSKWQVRWTDLFTQCNLHRRQREEDTWKPNLPYQNSKALTETENKRYWLLVFQCPPAVICKHE